jgi:hypothetical protein
MDIDVAPLFGCEVDLHNSSIIPTELFIAQQVVSSEDCRCGELARKLPFSNWKIPGESSVTLETVIENCKWMYAPRFSGAFLAMLGNYLELVCSDDQDAEFLALPHVVHAAYRKVTCVIMSADEFSTDLAQQCLQTAIACDGFLPHMVVYPGTRGTRCIRDDEFSWPVGFASFLFVSPPNMKRISNFNVDWPGFVEYYTEDDETEPLRASSGGVEEPIPSLFGLQDVKPKVDEAAGWQEELRKQTVIAHSQLVDDFKAQLVNTHSHAVRRHPTKFLGRDWRSVNLAVRAFRDTVCTLKHDSNSSWNYPPNVGKDS